MTKVYDNATDLITFARSSSGTALRRVGYGDEIFGDPSFDGTGDWSLADPDVTVSGGKLTYNAVNNIRGAQQNVNIYAGKVYQVSFEVLSGTARLFLSTGKFTSATFSNLGGDNYGVGVHQINVVANGDYSTIGFTLSKFLGGTACELAYFSMKEVIFDRATDDLVLFDHPDDIPRIEYGSDGSLKGLLIEEQRTNLLLQSQDLTNSSVWAAAGISPTRTDNNDGSFTLEDDNASGFEGVAQTVGITSGTSSYTASVDIKKTTGGTSKTAAVNFNLNGGTQVVNNVRLNTDTGTTTNATTASVQDVGDYWRVSATLTDNASGNTAVSFSLYPATDDHGGNIDDATVVGSATFRYPQLEEGSFPTSYIPTSGSTVTRSPDIASIPVSAFGYNQSAGTWVVDYSTFNTYTGSPYPRVMALSDGYSPREGLEILSFNNITNAAGYSNGSSTFSFVGPPSVKTAFAAKENNFAGSFGGGSVLTDVTGAMSTASLLEIGKYSGSAYLNGHIKSLSYFPRRLTDAQLQELTS